MRSLPFGHGYARCSPPERISLRNSGHWIDQQLLHPKLASQSFNAAKDAFRVKSIRAMLLTLWWFRIVNPVHEKPPRFLSHPPVRYAQ